jgi:hypothetical protein
MARHHSHQTRCLSLQREPPRPARLAGPARRNSW